MFLRYVCLFFLLTNVHLSWSRLVLPFLAQHPSPSKINPHSSSSSSGNAGQPLFLTPLIKSKKITEARHLSDVKPLLKNVVSNAGYLTVEEKYDSNLYFWFIRQNGDGWKKAPLLLWLQGGPGCSSLYGLFEENGPFFVTKKGILKRRKYAWTNEYNVLYIDQPVGTGFSFTNSSKGYVDDQNKIADHLYEALNQFFELYSELKNNEFYISGESYAGKYVPAVAYKIHKMKMAGKCKINLKGLFIVSGFSDPLRMCSYGKFTFDVGLIDAGTKAELESMEKSTKSYIRSRKWRQATTKWMEMLQKVNSASAEINFYDYTKDEVDLEDERFVKYIQSDDVRRKLHVGNATYSVCSDKVFEVLHEDISKSVKPWVEELLEHYQVAFVGGQLDVVVAYPHVAHFLDALQWSGAEEYLLSSKRKILYDNGRVVGYSKTASNLTDILVRRAGHMVPGDQPRVAFNILKQFVAKKLS